MLTLKKKGRALNCYLALPYGHSAPCIDYASLLAEYLLRTPTPLVIKYVYELVHLCLSHIKKDYVQGIVKSAWQPLC